MSATKQAEWTKPVAMAIPKGGVFEGKEQQGDTARFFPRPPPAMASRSSRRSSPAGRMPSTSMPRPLRRRWRTSRTSSPCSSSTTCAGCSSTMRARLLHVSGDLRHRFRQVHRGRCGPLRQSGINTVFENLEGFPWDWKTNPAAFVKFVRDHQCPSFMEYGEYPYVTADEIKKALKIKAALLDMLDQMQ